MMKSVLKWIAFFIGAFVLQTTLVPSLSIMGVKPDLLVLFLFMMAIKVGIMPAIYIGFVLGLAQDLYSPSILGQSALAKTIAGFFASLFNDKVMRLDPVFQAIILIFTFFINDIAVYIVQFVKTGTSFSGIVPELFGSTLPRSLYTLLFAIIPILWEQFSVVKIRR
jgi:rod shape-determining protein MreD